VVRTRAGCVGSCVRRLVRTRAAVNISMFSVCPDFYKISIEGELKRFTVLREAAFVGSIASRGT
jgi:hypothetical protein